MKKKLKKKKKNRRRNQEAGNQLSKEPRGRGEVITISNKRDVQEQ